METQCIKDWIMQKMARKFSNYKHKLKTDYYDKYITDEERIEHCPPDILRDQWIEFVHWVGAPEFQVNI